MADWVGRVGVALDPLARRLREKLRTLAILHADETPVGMLDPGSGKLHRSYLFAYRSGEGPPIIAFDFCISRSGAHARAFLGDWCGALMVDDYSGYKEGFKHGITELACWAHARRMFVDPYQASGSKIAEEAIARIGALYRIEAEAKDRSTAEPRAAPASGRARAA